MRENSKILNEELSAEIKIKYQRKKVMPKKIIFRQIIPLSKEPESCNLVATVWIPDTPQSNFVPRIVLTLSITSFKSLRIAFNTFGDLKRFVEALLLFIEPLGEQLAKCLKDAIREQERCWKYLRKHYANLHTDILYTSIQDPEIETRSKGMLSINQQINPPGKEDRATLESDLSALPGEGIKEIP